MACGILVGGIKAFAGYDSAVMSNKGCTANIELNNSTGSAYANTKMVSAEGLGTVHLTVNDQVAGVISTSVSEMGRNVTRSYMAWSVGDIVGANSLHRLYNNLLSLVLTEGLHV